MSSSSYWSPTHPSTLISEPGRVFWGADEELSDGGSPQVIVYGYDGLPMQPVALPFPDYVPGPEHLPSPDYMPGPEHHTFHCRPGYHTYLSLSSLCYVADSDPDEDPEEDPEEDHADYPADGGDGDDEPSDDDDDDDDTDDEDEEPFEDEDDVPRMWHDALAPADSSVVPITDHVPSAKDTKALETNEAAPTPVPSPRRHTTRMSVRPQTPVPLPSEVEVKRLLALPIPPVSLLTPLSSPLPQIPSPPLLPLPSSLHLPPPVPTSLPLPLSLLPPLPALLFLPPVDHREDTIEAELPPRLSALWMLRSDDREPRRLAMSLGMFR
ncbi:hypothetical protein Tco_0688973 [Tanacetum coccineum]